MYLLVLKYKMVDKISIGIGLITWFSYQNAMRTGFPVMKTGFSLSEKTSQGKPCFHYRDGFYGIQRLLFQRCDIDL